MDKKFCKICFSHDHDKDEHSQFETEILKKNNMPEKRKELEEKGPNTLDVIKIDGKWAQFLDVSGYGPEGKKTAIIFLGNEEKSSLDLRYYRLAKVYNVPVGVIKDQMTFSEFENISWYGSDEPGRDVETVMWAFGEYVKK